MSSDDDWGTMMMIFLFFLTYIRSTCFLLMFQQFIRSRDTRTDADDWEAPDVDNDKVPTFSDEEEEEDLSLSEPVVKAVPKSKKPKELTQEKSKKRSIIARKEEAEMQRKARLEEALKQVSNASGRQLSEKEKHSLIVEKADNLLCEDLFGSLAKKEGVQVEENVLEGEDLMAGEGRKDGNKNGAATTTKVSVDPMEAIENAISQLSLKDEMECLKLANLVSAAINRSDNSTNILQFMELMIKAVSQSLDSSQFKSLSSACNVQKNIKQKEEKVGKKKKKKSTKKILKTQNDDAFMDCAGMEDYGDYGW